MAPDATSHPAKRDADVSKVPNALLLPSGSRRRLTDITNLPQREIGRKPFPDNKNPSFAMPADGDDYARLLKENTDLLRLLGEKNQIIERSNLELQKSRMVISKLQVQNWQLAHANSQMLADLNLGKDRLKALQHELGCTASVLKIKTSELEEMGKFGEKVPAKMGNKEDLTGMAQDEPHHIANAKFPKRKWVSENNREVPGNSTCTNLRSVSSSTVVCQVAGGEKDEKKRRSRRPRTSSSMSQLDELKYQSIEHPEVSQCEDRTENVDRPDPVSMDAISSKNTNDQRTEEVPLTSNSTGENNENEKSVGRHLSNHGSRTDKNPLKELAHDEKIKEIQPFGPKPTSGYSTSMESVERYTVRKKEPVQSPQTENQQAGRLSTGRPSRRVTMGKSYKEIPLNVKMRRP